LAYSADLQALNPDHHWDFDGDSVDGVGAVGRTDTGILFTGDPIAEDTTFSMYTDSFNQLVSITSTSDIDNGAHDRKAVAGWFMVDAFMPPPGAIYREGNATTCFHFAYAYGNYLLFECVEPTNFTLQVFGPALVPNRVYHLCGIFEGSGYANEIRFYVDGVEQTDASPTNRQPGTASLDARTVVAQFGCNPGSTATGIGGSVVNLNSGIRAYYNHWATWEGADAGLTGTEVREEAFEKGVLPDVTISTASESAMQTALDAYADTVRDNAPLCIRIEDCSDGDFELVLDNITFDSLASIHVQYTGNDTLTLLNANGSDASLISTPSTGTVALRDRVDITITVLDLTTGLPIDGARVYIEAETGGDLPDETEILNDTTNASGIATTTLDYTSDQPIVGRVRHGTTSTYYKTGTITGPIGSTGLTQTILLIPDE